MNTFILKAKDVKRDWYVIDAAGIPLGRVASKAATLLMGKNKPTYTRNIDDGDFVIIVNAEKIVLTGRKASNKNYFHYSGYQGGLRVTPFKSMIVKKPTFPLEQAIKGMLPKNILARKMIKKLTLIAGPDHNVKNVTVKNIEI